MKHFLRSTIGVTVLLLIAFGYGCDNIMEPALQESEQPIENLSSGDVIEGSYIVVLRSSEDQAKLNEPEYAAEIRSEVLKDSDIRHDRITAEYNRVLHGFAANLSKEQVDRLMSDDRVSYVEPDRVVTLAPPCGTPRGGECDDDDDGDDGDGGDDGGSGDAVVPWGIDRVGGAVSYSGNNVAWVIDTGIQLDHPDLNVDADRSEVFVARGPGSNSPDDGNGHGTHVAGTIAAYNSILGVASGATTVAVKVLDDRGSGQYSWVIAGVDYVAENGNAGDVANMSLGGPTSDALDDAVRNAADQGIYFALAAGNDGADANNYSPARVQHSNSWTIAATDSDDVFASWSNYGNPPVSHAAPGVSILSTWINSGTRTISGTSMAAPHVAGILLVTGGNVNSDGFSSTAPDGVNYPIASHN